MSICLRLLAALLILLQLPVTAANGPYHPAAIHRLSRQTGTGAYSFIVTGDNRDGNSVFARLLKKGRDYSPRFLLHTGDFVPAGSKSDYQHYLGMVQGAPYPVLTAIGNHDVVGQGRRWYQRYFGQAEFAFNYGRDRFIFVDNANGRVSPAQLKRLTAELKKPARYRFVIMHMPPGNVIWFHAFTDGSQEMMRVLEAHKANYVFLGHIHIFDKMHFRGVNYLVSGGAGAPLYRMPLYFSDRGGAFHHFTLIQVSDKGIKDTVVPL